MKGITFSAILSMALLLILATGCAKKKPDSDIQKATPVKVESDHTDDLFKIRYRLKWLHQAQFAGAYMAKEKGFYRRRGLDVEILPGGVDFPPYKSLMEGSADLANFNLINALKDYNSSRPVVNLAQISQKNSTLLLGKKTSGIKTINDLRGKKIGVWRGESGLHTILFLEGLNQDIQVIPLDWSINLLLSNAIDMMSGMDYNEYNRILMSGLDADELVIFNLADYGSNVIDDGLYATKDFYTRHEQQCQDFAKATLEGWTYAFKHREETLNVVLRYQRESHIPANPEHQAWMLDHMKDRVLDKSGQLGHLNQSDFDLAHRILTERGLLTEPVEYRSFYPHENTEKN